MNQVKFKESSKLDWQDFITKDREENGHKRFEGTFLDYLAVVQDHSKVTQLAHARLYEVITAPGVRELSSDEHLRLKRIHRNQKIKVNTFFAGEFFGMEPVIA
ncbi:MAG: hypothetical protein HYZ72_11660, partial [Deltaproteobacteria bacterium]|nr:hypothetical protein [Deltaproteobacteria bacterium]